MKMMVVKGGRGRGGVEKKHKANGADGAASLSNATQTEQLCTQYTQLHLNIVVTTVHNPFRE
jgi:hypothetical protein